MHVAQASALPFHHILSCPYPVRPRIFNEDYTVAEALRMSNPWITRVGTIRGWLYAAALVAIGIIWLVRH